MSLFKRTAYGIDLSLGDGLQEALKDGKTVLEVKLGEGLVIDEDGEVETDGGGGGGGLSPGGVDVKNGNGALDLTKGSHIIAAGTSFSLADGSTDKDHHTIHNTTASLVIISHKGLDNTGTPQVGSNIYLYSGCTAAVEWNATAGGWVRRQAIQFPSAPTPQLIPNSGQHTENGTINDGSGHWFLNGGDAFTIDNPTSEDVAITIRNNTGGPVTLTAPFYEDDVLVASLVIQDGAFLFLQWNQNKWIIKMLAVAGSGAATGYESRSSAGVISNTLAHTDLFNDGVGTSSLADSTVDGFEKTIRVGTAATPYTINMNFINFGSLSGVGSNIVMAANSSIRLMWSEANERYVIRDFKGTVTFNIGGGS
jgi:hypothetical protein